MKEGMEFTGENIDRDMSGEPFADAIAKHYKHIAEDGFPDDISPLQDAFFAEKGIPLSDVNVVN